MLQMNDWNNWLPLLHKNCMRDDIQHILSGKSQVKHHHLIQTTCSYLKGSQGASSMAKDQQQHKEEETKSLIQFA